MLTEPPRSGDIIHPGAGLRRSTLAIMGEDTANTASGDASAGGAAPTPAAENSEPRSPSVQALRHFGCGLGMGTADAVPGVSGGTIALILGIYAQLIGSLHALIGLVTHPRDRDHRRAAIDAIRFLAPLLVGVVCALFIATRVLVGNTKDVLAMSGDEQTQAMLALPGWLVNPSTAPYVFAVFFGLVAASVREPWAAKQLTKWPVDIPLFVVGTAVASTLALLPPMGVHTSPVIFIIAGAVAISVMLLPGISGSLALLVLGLYQPISEAANNLDFSILVWFILGVVFGAAAFIPILRKLLRAFHDRTMSLLAGLMMGSLVALWPWKAHYIPKLIPDRGPMTPQAPDDNWWLVVLCALIGAALIIGVSFVAKQGAKRGVTKGQHGEA